MSLNALGTNIHKVELDRLATHVGWEKVGCQISHKAHGTKKLCYIKVKKLLEPLT